MLCVRLINTLSKVEYVRWIKCCASENVIGIKNNGIISAVNQSIWPKIELPLSFSWTFFRVVFFRFCFFVDPRVYILRQLWEPQSTATYHSFELMLSTFCVVSFTCLGNISLQWLHHSHQLHHIVQATRRWLLTWWYYNWMKDGMPAYFAFIRISSQLRSDCLSSQ